MTRTLALLALAAPVWSQSAPESRLLVVDVDGGELHASSTEAVAGDLVLLGALPPGTTAADLDARADVLWIVRPTASGDAEAGTVDLDTLEYTVRGRNQPFAAADEVTASADGRDWFVVTQDGGSARIFSGDLQHARMSELVTLPGSGPITGLAAGLGGELYAFADDTNELLTIDAVSGDVVSSVVVSLSGEAVGLDVDATTGRLVCHYKRGASSRSFAELDPASGAVTVLEDLGALSFDPRVVVRRSSREVEVVRLCADAAPNVTGVASTLSARGDRRLERGDLTVIARSLPTGTFGLLLASRTAGAPVTPPGAVGGLCLSGAVGRIASPGGLLPTGDDGSFSATLDLGAIPQPGGALAALAYESWSFQAWFRDALQGAATSNFSDAIQVSFAGEYDGVDYLVPTISLTGRELRYHDVTGDGREELLAIANVAGSAGPFEVFAVDDDGVPVQSLGGRWSNWNGEAVFHDFDGDGDLDAVAGTRSSRVAVLLGDGAGDFVEVDRIVVCQTMHSMRVLDVDQDGRMDVAFGCQNTYENQVLYGLGGGAFGQLQSIPSGAFKPHDSFFTDVSGDGLADVVHTSGSVGTAANRFGYSVNLGNRQFGSQTDVATLGGLRGAFMGDLDADGDDDLVTVHLDRLDVYPNVPGVGFGARIGAPMPVGATVLDADDHDGDGRLDFIVQSETQMAPIELLRGIGDGTFVSSTLATYARASGGPVSGPLASGARVLAGRFPSTVEFVPLSSPAYVAGTLVSEAYGAPRTNNETEFQPLVLAELTGDGRLDAVVATASLGTNSLTLGSLRLMRGRGDGTFEPGDEIAPMLARSVEVVDEDGDGTLDLVAAIDGALIGLRVYRGDGTGQFAFASEVPTSSPCVRTSTADFTGDGVNDIAVALDAGGLALHAGFGGSAFGAPTLLAPGRTLTSAARADFDGDGRSDLVAVDTAAGELVVFWGATSGGLEPPAVLGPAGEQLTLVDVDGDGVLDVAADGDDALHVYLTMPDRQVVLHSEPISGPSGLGRRRLVAGDLDRDGLGDVVLGSDAKGLVLFRSVGFGTVSEAWRWGSHPLLGDLAVGDLNGDGVLDLASTTVRRASVTAHLHRTE